MLTSSVLTALLWRGLDPPWQKQEGTILYYSSLLCSLCLFTSLQTQDRTFCWVSAHVPFHVTRLTARIIGLTGVYKTACFLCNESVQSVEETCVTSNKFSGKRVQHFFCLQHVSICLRFHPLLFTISSQTPVQKFDKGLYCCSTYD